MQQRGKLNIATKQNSQNVYTLSSPYLDVEIPGFHACAVPNLYGFNIHGLPSRKRMFSSVGNFQGYCGAICYVRVEVVRHAIRPSHQRGVFHAGKSPATDPAIRLMLACISVVNPCIPICASKLPMLPETPLLNRNCLSVNFVRRQF
jgi:hypothetical protein